MTRRLLAALVLCGFVSSTHAASFLPLGDLPGGTFNSYVGAVSADGRFVVGTSDSGADRFEAFIWDATSGMVGLGHFPGGIGSSAVDISADGQFVVGKGCIRLADCGNNDGSQAYVWSAGDGLQGLGYLPGGTLLGSGASGISRDGQVIVGASTSSNSGSNFEAFRWTEASGLIGLGDLEGSFFSSTAVDTSADGSIVIGNAQSEAGREVFRWDAVNGMIGLGDLVGGVFASAANEISSDGDFIVGMGQTSLGAEAFVWDSVNGMVGLGPTPGCSTNSVARAVSDDGSIIAVNGFPQSGTECREAYLYFAIQSAMMPIAGILENQGVDLAGWTLTGVFGMTPDGLTLVGRGINLDGNNEAWIATIDPAVIPIPAAVWLFGSALAFIGFIKRGTSFSSR